METKGQITGFEVDYLQRRVNVHLSLEDPDMGELERLSKSLRGTKVRLTEWRDMKSLEANGYAWRLLGELATVQDADAYDIYESYLFAQPKFCEDEEGKHLIITIPSNRDVREFFPKPKKGEEGFHWFFYKQSADGKWTSYIRIRGMSSFNTLEMTHFINLIVQDCKEQGIETMTPQQIKEMNERWGLEHG